MKASDPTDATSACPMRVQVSIKSLISSTPLGIGGGDAATTTNKSSTIYLQRFSTHATGGPRARKPWMLRAGSRILCRTRLVHVVKTRKPASGMSKVRRVGES